MGRGNLLMQIVPHKDYIILHKLAKGKKTVGKARL